MDVDIKVKASFDDTLVSFSEESDKYNKMFENYTYAEREITERDIATMSSVSIKA